MNVPGLIDRVKQRIAPAPPATSPQDMYDDPANHGEHPGNSIASVRLQAVTIAPDIKQRVLAYLAEHRPEWMESIKRDGNKIGDVRLVHDIIEVIIEKEHEAADFVTKHEREIKVAGVAGLVGTAIAAAALMARRLRARRPRSGD